MRKATLFALIVSYGLIARLSARAAVVDLGTIAIGTNVNASVVNAEFSSQLETYTYQQLIFQSPDLGLTLDSHLTVAEVLAQDLGSANGGTLDYNFPFTFGASGSYSQVGLPLIGVSPGTMLDFTATSVSGQIYSGFNNVGATIGFDPTDAARTYSAILGGSGVGLSDLPPTSSTTTVTLTLGLIGDTVYEAEDSTTTWTSSGTVLNAVPTATPEPRLGWMSLVVFGAVVVTRRISS